MNNDILLVEDNPDGATPTLRGFRSNKVTNPIFVVRDGIEAVRTLGVYRLLLNQPLPERAAK